VSGFNSQVALSDAWVGATPAGVSVSLPNLVTVSAGGTVTLTLTLNAADSVSTGAYTLLVTATGGGIAHSTQLTISIAGT
jgi:phosphoribosylformylglycinamidine (FGAM) synthase-like enzyme